MRARGGSDAARQHQRLIIGPWSHGYFGNIYVEQDYGILASTDAADLTAAQLRWFDYWLKGAQNGCGRGCAGEALCDGQQSVAHGIGHGRCPARSIATTICTAAARPTPPAAMALLSQAAPGSEPPDEYTYDPRNPVPTAGGQSLLPGSLIALNVGPRDQRAVESRPDVLCYTTPPLEHDTEVIGPIELVLYIASSARDTDFTGKLVDVFPDGRALALTDGILRARYRNSLAAPELLEPGTILRAAHRSDRDGECVPRRPPYSDSIFPAATSRASTGTPTPAARSPAKPQPI